MKQYKQLRHAFNNNKKDHSNEESRKLKEYNVNSNKTAKIL